MDQHRPPVIELRGITKRFPGVVANDRVDLAVREGEIHAIVGENGAGKSTLMKVLYGLYPPDAGEILIRARRVAFHGPRDALAAGIGMVHQHFMLIPRFTVAENVILGSEPSSRGVLALGQAQREIGELARRYGFAIDPRAPVGGLSVGEQQRVEILKILYRGAEILILDEPTAVLVPQEVEELFRNLRELRQGGKTIIFISHKLDEVLEIADRITVLRRGRTVGTVDHDAATKPRLAEMMVGRPVLLDLQRPEVAPGEPALVVDHLSISGDAGRLRVRDVSFAVREGEIYAVAGVEGNGQTELVEAIVGLRPMVGGRVLLEGRDISRLSIREEREAGLAYIPEDRHRRGLILPLAVWENLILGLHRRPEFANGALVDIQAARTFAADEVRAFDIRTRSVDTPVLALSGGNQQKVVVARALSFEPRVLIASQPTRGLDIGATEFVRTQLLGAKAAGRAVLLVSADLDEVLSLGDRIGVMFSGELVAEVPRGEATPQTLGLYMLGTRRAAGAGR